MPTQTTNFSVHPGTTFININVVNMTEAAGGSTMNHYYQYSDQTPTSSFSPQARLAFILTVMLNLVQVKYEGKPDSPFETRPKTMFLALVNLLALYYCFSSTSSSSSSDSSRRRPRTTTTISAIFMEFCGSLSLASLLSVLLSQSLSPLVFTLSLLFSLCQVLLPISPSHLLQTIWNLIKLAVRFISHKFHPQPTHHAMRRRRGGGSRGGVQVQLPWLSRHHHHHVHAAIFNHLDTQLPV